MRSGSVSAAGLTETTVVQTTAMKRRRKGVMLMAMPLEMLRCAAFMNPAQQILQVATGYMASSALYAAITLNIADHLAAGAKSTAELARVSGANADALYRVL